MLHIYNMYEAIICLIESDKTSEHIETKHTKKYARRDRCLQLQSKYIIKLKNLLDTSLIERLPPQTSRHRLRACRRPTAGNTIHPGPYMKARAKLIYCIAIRSRLVDIASRMIWDASDSVWWTIRLLSLANYSVALLRCEFALLLLFRSFHDVYGIN